MNGTDVYSLVLQQLDRAPVTRQAQRIVANPFHWREKVRALGYATPNHQLDYQRIYKFLYQANFDADEAYLAACAAGNKDTVAFLQEYSTQHQECATVTQSSEVLQLTNLTEDEADTVMLDSIQQPGKLAALVVLYYPIRIVVPVLESDVVEAQVIVIDALSLPDLVKYTGLINNRVAAKAVEDRGYIFDYPEAVRFNLSNSTSQWLANRPPTLMLQDALKLAIMEDATQSGILIANGAAFNLEPYLILAVRRGNDKLAKYLLNKSVSTDQALTEAIRANHVNVIKVLASKATDKHRRLAKGLHRTEIYNLIR